MILNIRYNNKKVYIREGQCRLLREYYGIPNGIESFVDEIMSEVRHRWANGTYDEFTLPVNGLPLGYIEIRPTTMNVRACYAMPPSGRYRPCILFIRPEIVFDDSDEDATLHATMVHELTHMIEDIGRRKSEDDGLGGELERLGYPKVFDNVINNRMFAKENEGNYSGVERAVNRVMFYGVGFERNARNAAMFTKLKDLPAGRIKTYDDAIKFLRSTTEFNRYERSVASAWFLVNLTDAKKQAEALSVVSQCSNYKFKNWNGFRKWLKGFIRRYEDKMKRVIPKMINHVINPPVSEGRLISEAQMNFDSLYYMRDGEDITEYVINYINWSGRGEFDPSFSVLASKLHDGLMYTLGLSHEDADDRRVFARIISYCRTLLKTIVIEKIRCYFDDEWSITSNRSSGNSAMMFIHPNDFRNGEYSSGKILRRAIVYQTHSGVKEVNSEYRPGSDNGSSGVYFTSAIMTDEMKQKILDMHLVPALRVEGSYHENFIDCVGILPEYVSSIKDKPGYGNIFFECKFDLNELEDDEYDDYEDDDYEDDDRW